MLKLFTRTSKPSSKTPRTRLPLMKSLFYLTTSLNLYNPQLMTVVLRPTYTSPLLLSPILTVALLTPKDQLTPSRLLRMPSKKRNSKKSSPKLLPLLLLLSLSLLNASPPRTS
ncbi:hypothetical protein TTHERM_002653334 (macronuclear) [Tetrahymena thermophila SB210]|uniref:Uncharacterized protein n=1 Tax=Tetrahymena thermophila (strain SB210) TaxID=312017 RepID=W7XBY0_TETTS|nr:hypothetical protein TTHERM_002653334 [Tetrahymena thermophila SB210]EWS76880.1 hypothetical protein TTHERM_002653334 [Tetrahymena thermophila SB210]|eukprot:XP_012650585.1 hypothetical protein TTHERM_002653334 [Tetrahymena thermophila SB210]